MSKADLQVVNGILLVNKPKGLTSNAVLQQVKRLFRAKKAGHTGSLDPMATGMLPICFGEATKFSQYLLDADKCYEATGLLGIKTNTGDAMGDIISQTQGFTISESQLQTVLQQFLGKIKQIPSMFSALKHHGLPLYKYARAGIEIPREAREIIIHDLKLHHFDGQAFSIKVICSKGTYIRNLIEDIGTALGVGAHVTKLHRAYTTGFAQEPMFTIEELQLKSREECLSHLLPLDYAISYLPKLDLDPESVQNLRCGKVVTTLKNFDETPGCVRLYQGDVFIGLGDIQVNQLKVKRLLAL
jgi:tRNA pseudouridine55 synthase